MTRRIQIAVLSGVLITGMIGLAGCDNSVDPLADDADQVFSIQGFLDAGADSQFVRIEALRSTVLADKSTMDDVTVRTIDLSDGDEVAWADSVVRLDDGSDGRLFYGLFRPESGHSYRIQVSRGDVDTASATTTVPGSISVSTGVPRGDTLQFIQDVVLLGLAEAPLDISVYYDVSMSPTGPAIRVQIPYSLRGVTSGSGWGFEVFFSRDRFEVRRVLGVTDTMPVFLSGVGVIISLPSDEWDQQDAPINLDNAEGFFGSIGRFSVGWTLAPADIGKLGFVP